MRIVASQIIKLARLYSTLPILFPPVAPGAWSLPTTGKFISLTLTPKVIVMMLNFSQNLQGLIKRGTGR